MRSMKYFLSVLILLCTTNIFAISQTLIDAASEYHAIEQDIIKLEISAEVDVEIIKERVEKLQDKLMPADEQEFIRASIDRNSRELVAINSQLAEKRAELKKLIPLKVKYDKAVARDRKMQEIIDGTLNVLGILGLPLAGFWLVIYLNSLQQKRYKRMLLEGKITEEEYKNLIAKMKEYSHDVRRSNPSTGLPLTGNNSACDVGGNTIGSSSYSPSGYSGTRSSISSVSSDDSWRYRPYR